MKKSILTIAFALVAIIASAQTGLKKVYDETINPMEQIDNAVATAKSATPEKYVICQVGGNWCPWCLRFADFISRDSDIAKVVNDNFVYIHVNYNPRKSGGEEQVKATTKKKSSASSPFGCFVFGLSASITSQ